MRPAGERHDASLPARNMSAVSRATAIGVVGMATHPSRFWLARALLAWLLIAVLETLHGVARTLWLMPRVGDLRARQIAIFGALALVFAVAFLAVHWINARGTRRLLTVGALWLALMVGFDVLLGRALGLSWARIAADFNPLAGGFLGIGMATMLFAPWLAARLRRLN